MTDPDAYGPEARQLAYLILSGRKDRPLDAAQTAYIFGCDSDSLRAAYVDHLEQSEEWSAAALEARRSGDEVGVEACQHEARSWAREANTLREAAELCEERLLTTSDWSLTEQVRRYHEASAQRWHEFHVVRERLGLADPDPVCCESVGCCLDECCGGEDCDCPDCAVGWATCTVCGDVRAARPVPPEPDLSAVDADPTVAAARRREDELLGELYTAFDAAVVAWRRQISAADRV